MIGGLLKSASAVALFAAAGLYGASAAKAADLGGDCCADLEERVAELEATTVRKGNRKVSLTISGYVSHHVMWWNDGTQSDAYIGDGGNYGSRWRFTGTAKISPSLTAGFLYEYAANTNAIGSMNQLNGGDDLGQSGAGCNGNLNTVGCAAIRDSTVWLRHKSLGMVKIGHGSTATDNLVLIDVGGLAGAATPDVSLYNGGFLLRSNGGLFSLGTGTGPNAGAATSLNWTAAVRGHESWDTGRRNHVLYETPSLAGFTLQAAVAEDNYWDVALRYAGEFGGFRIAGGIGYQEDTKFNAPAQSGAGTTSVICTANCDVKSTEIKGSASIMHVPTGLFLTGAAGKREIEGTSGLNVNGGIGGGTAGAYAGPDARFWWLSGGISQNWFGIGRTVLFGEYGEHKGGLAQATFITGIGSGPAPQPIRYDSSVDSTVTNWGVGIVQNIDAAAMEIFLAYKSYSLETTGFRGVNAPLNTAAGGGVGTSDFQTVIMGTRIQF